MTNDNTKQNDTRHKQHVITVKKKKYMRNISNKTEKACSSEGKQQTVKRLHAGIIKS